MRPDVTLSTRRKYTPVSRDMALLPSISVTYFQKQIGIDREMRVMLVPHGSASVHCGFMPIGGEVIEIFSPLHINPSVLQYASDVSFVPPNCLTNPNHDPYEFGWKPWWIWITSSLFSRRCVGPQYER